MKCGDFSLKIRSENNGKNAFILFMTEHEMQIKLCSSDFGLGLHAICICLRASIQLYNIPCQRYPKQDLFFGGKLLVYIY